MLFFLWGFAFGIVNSLNAQIRNLLHYSAAQSIALQDAYWAAYLFGPVCIGYWMLKYQGFKATFMTGLAVASVGLMSFWPSSVLASYPGFLISNFIIALGLSTLENAANPFIALSGPSELSEARLLFSQGMQAVGTVVAPLLAEKALFSGIDQQDLFRVQWCYLAVALFVVILAIVFYYVPLSEAPDDALDAMAARRLLNAGLEGREKALGMSTRHLVLWTAVLAQMSYAGAQESTDYFWPQLANGTKPGVDPFWTLIIGRALFTFGRFLASGLTYWGVTPRVVLGVSAFGAFTTSILAMVLPQGTAALSMLMLVQFFEAPLFPTIFAVGIRNQGRHTKFAATAITATIPAAGWWPTIAYAVDLSHGTNYRFALRITIVLFGIILLWPVLLSSTRVLRRWVDPKWSKRAPRQELESGVPSMVDNTPPLSML
jgi:fucose permease